MDRIKDGDTTEKLFPVSSAIKKRIYNGWTDEKVATWVISQLPLLDIGERHTSVPVLKLSLEKGLEVDSGIIDLETFKNSNKLVISGGFEGNQGHLLAIENLNDSQILAYPNYLKVLQLEPDSYVVNTKKRQPLLNLSERVVLWSTSQKVDTVVILPERQEFQGIESHYTEIDRLIQPANWFASTDNPYWRKIITRPGKNIIDISQLVDHEPEMHTSFLMSTRNMNVHIIRSSKVLLQ